MAGVVSSFFLFCLFLWPLANLTPAFAVVATPEFLPDRILIKPAAGIAPTELEHFHALQNTTVRQRFRLSGVEVLQLPPGAAVPGAVAAYQKSGLVEFAEPDYILHADATIPNDPKFLDGTLWALDNYGQNGGTPGADIHAVEAWDVQTSASNVVVAVLDTGIRYTHEDLAANMWVNTNDGSHGFDAFTGTNDPNDDNGHGTLIAGVLGGVGNNGKGVAGVAWQVQMMACKCLGSNGLGSDSTLIACIEFAQTNGAQIINASLDSSGYSDAVADAISNLRDAGIIFVASAGNNWGTDVDVTPRYPACYEFDNIVSVSYTTRNDYLGPISNYGATNVDLAAPGDQIYSTCFASNSDYNFNTPGTSFAAGYVSGALALMKQKFPLEDYHQTIFRLLQTVDPLPDLAGTCVTGGRLNVQNALSPPIVLLPLSSNAEPFQLRVSAGPYGTFAIETSPDLVNWSPIYTNSTGTNWSFDFTDEQSTNSAQKFYRAIQLQ